MHIDLKENDAQLAATGANQSANQTTVLARLSVSDADLPTSNHLNFAILTERHSRHFERMRDDTLDSLPTSTLRSLSTSGNGSFSEHFLLSPNAEGNSASLRLHRPLDYETPRERFISLLVAVTDKGDDFTDRAHLDTAVVYIRLRDANDNAPVFTQAFVNVSLAENTHLGVIVTKFAATDADGNGHSQVTYSLEPGSNRRRYFTIDSEGLVRLNRPLDRETAQTHILKVVASDTDEPPLTSTATLGKALLFAIAHAHIVKNRGANDA